MSPPPFQTLLDLHGRDVQRFLAALVGAQEAGDVAQETWLAALRAYPSLNSASNLKGWVMTIAHRKALDHFRHAARAPLAGEQLPVADGRPAGTAPEPASSLRDGVWELVRALPEKQRGAVAMRYLLDLGYGEIALALDCSEEAARRSVHEGLKRLREEYVSDEH